MTDSVVRAFPGNLDPIALLEMAKRWNLESCLVIGWNEEGEFCIGGSEIALKETQWLVSNAQMWINNEMMDEPH